MTNNQLSADILERSASGYAGFAASLMLERDPSLSPSGGFESWKAHLTQRLLELSASVAADETHLFRARVLWSRKAFRARGQSEALLCSSLECLREVLAKNMAAAASAIPLVHIDDALKSLHSIPADDDPTALDPAREADRIALRFLQCALEGDSLAAIRELTAARDRGMDVLRIYVDVLLAAQREIGRLWHVGEVTVAEEHMVSFTTQRAMAVLSSSAPSLSPQARTVVAAAVAGNAHDIGIRAAADLYQLSGWRCIFLGSDVPLDDLPGILSAFNAEVLLLGATLSTHISRAERAIRVVRERCDHPVRIILGGAAFDEVPEIWRRLGADAYANSVEQALALGNTR